MPSLVCLNGATLGALELPIYTVAVDRTVSSLAFESRLGVGSPPSFLIVLNGYMSSKARITSTGEEKMTDHTVGVDISKRHLDAFQLPGEKAAQFTNDAAGFRKLIAWIGKSIEWVAYEPTGPYHRDFELALLKAKLPMAKVNPWQARRFAQATATARQDRCGGCAHAGGDGRHAGP